MSDVLLESRWGDTKDALLEGLEGNRRNSMSVVLENTKRYLQEAATTGASAAGNVATLNRVILPVIRRVMPTVIANEIVGVQPMQGPVGQIHTLRVRYADSVNSTASAPFDTDTTAGDEALSPFKIATAYSGSTTTGKADTTAAKEGVGGNKLSIQILKQPVEARQENYRHVGHLKQLKTHNQCTVLMWKQKSWQHLHKRLLQKSTKKFLVHYVL